MGRKNALVIDPSKITESDRRRFWAKVSGTGVDQCWNWTAYRNAKGYGKFGWTGKTHSAYRWSYVLHNGPIPVDLVIDHLCRNPACVNPAHMEPVPHETNISRGIARNAKTKRCPQGHPYDTENTYFENSADGYQRRVCRTCKLAKLRARNTDAEHQAKQREYRQRTRARRLEWERSPEAVARRKEKYQAERANLTPERREAHNARARANHQRRMEAKRAAAQSG